jgi:multidrug efflux system outer membrane protein
MERPQPLFAPAWLLLLSLCLAGCAVGPKYQRPPLDVPAGFRHEPAAATTNSLADLPWWSVFKDAALQDLIRTALTNNYDLRLAVARVDQARAILAGNRSLFFPMLNYNGMASRGKNVVDNNPFANGATEGYYVADIQASWEIDLWGRIRRLNESARAQMFASQEARRGIMVSLVSQVAEAYFQLLALDQEMDIAKRTTNSFGESLTIFSERLTGGVASKLETSAAQAALASAAATVPDLERQIDVQENLINVLLGRNPGPVPRSHALLQEHLPPVVPAGLPSALLERRPDVREAEQDLRSANAQVGAAVADYFPQITLTGLLGAVSPELSSITGGSANAWSLAAGVTGPLFRAGQLSAARHLALAAREQARLRYQQTVLNAFREVSDQLMARQKFADQRVQQQIAVQAYEVAVQVSKERYVAGRASYYEVLQEQQLLFPAQNTLVQVELDQLLAVVRLYRALGGGYER